MPLSINKLLWIVALTLVPLVEAKPTVPDNGTQKAWGDKYARYSDAADVVVRSDLTPTVVSPTMTGEFDVRCSDPVEYFEVYTNRQEITFVFVDTKGNSQKTAFRIKPHTSASVDNQWIYFDYSRSDIGSEGKVAMKLECGLAVKENGDLHYKCTITVTNKAFFIVSSKTVSRAEYTFRRIETKK